MTKASVFLPSYNKPDYVLDAIRSVFVQDFLDWELWILENSSDDVTRQVIKDSGYLDDPRVNYREIGFTDAQRKQFYPPATLLNDYYPQANGETIYYVSDDDLLLWPCLSACEDFFEDNPDKFVCYFGLFISSVALGKPEKSLACCTATTIRTSGMLNGVIDGGQIAHRKSCLDKIGPRPFPEKRKTAWHSDGVFMEKLAEFYDFHPIRRALAVHRQTPLSTWVRYDPDTGCIISGQTGKVIKGR